MDDKKIECSTLNSLVANIFVFNIFVAYRALLNMIGHDQRKPADHLFRFGEAQGLTRFNPWRF